MRSDSPRHNFLRTNNEDQDYFDNLIQVDRTQYSPSKKGDEVHGSLTRTKVLRGGLGSGKTRCAGEHVNALALSYPGSAHIIARKDLGKLRDTTQKEFLEKVVAPETIGGFLVNTNDLHYKNGSVIHFRETKDPDSFKSYEITSYTLDEADENDTDVIWDRLDDRLRQKIMIDGVWITPPYAGLLVLNPTYEEHWICQLSRRKDISVGDYQFSTYDNAHNLPPDYIPNLLKKLSPWDIDRLIFGNWGREIKGKPVIHGFTMENNVRSLRFRDDLPLIRGWDFGFNHPACSFGQIEPDTGRYLKLRELLGSREYLPSFVAKVKEMTISLCGPKHLTEDYGDPHGNDQKDTGQSSIDYLRDHHQIYVRTRRARIKGGLEEIQAKVLARKRYGPEEDKREESLFLVDHSCRISIAAYMGGYHRDEDGTPVKDGYYDHVVDTDRYPVEYKKHIEISHKYSGRSNHRPKNRITGY